jgi:hypothetical protein
MRRIVFMGWQGLVALTLWAGLADARAQNYPAPGFDCANASTPQELRICRSPQLSALDGRHWYLADRAIRGSADRDATRSEVEGWINRVRNECPTDACLVDAYTARIAQLEGSVAQLAPEKPPPQPRMLSTSPASPAAADPPPAVTGPAPAPAPAAKPAPIPEASPGVPMWAWLVLAAVIVAGFVMGRRKKGSEPFSGRKGF